MLLWRPKQIQPGESSSRHATSDSTDGFFGEDVATFVP